MVAQGPGNVPVKCHRRTVPPISKMVRFPLEPAAADASPQSPRPATASVPSPAASSPPVYSRRQVAAREARADALLANYKQQLELANKMRDRAREENERLKKKARTDKKELEQEHPKTQKLLQQYTSIDNQSNTALCFCVDVIEFTSIQNPTLKIMNAKKVIRGEMEYKNSFAQYLFNTPAHTHLPKIYRIFVL